MFNTQEFSKLTTEKVAAKLNKAKLASQNDIFEFIKKQI